MARKKELDTPAEIGVNPTTMQMTARCGCGTVARESGSYDEAVQALDAHRAPHPYPRGGWTVNTSQPCAASDQSSPHVDVDALVARLDSLAGDDPEADHGVADDVLLQAVDPRVRAAYERVAERCPWWATA